MVVMWKKTFIYWICYNYYYKLVLRLLRNIENNIILYPMVYRNILLPSFTHDQMFTIILCWSVCLQRHVYPFNCNKSVVSRCLKKIISLKLVFKWLSSVSRSQIFFIHIYKITSGFPCVPKGCVFKRCLECIKILKVNNCM